MRSGSHFLKRVSPREGMGAQAISRSSRANFSRKPRRRAKRANAPARRNAARITPIAVAGPGTAGLNAPRDMIQIHTGTQNVCLMAWSAAYAGRPVQAPIHIARDAVSKWSANQYAIKTAQLAR